MQHNAVLLKVLTQFAHAFLVDLGHNKTSVWYRSSPAQHHVVCPYICVVRAPSTGEVCCFVELSSLVHDLEQ